MDDHRSRKRRRHSRQLESAPGYAPERQNPAQPADIGCDTPARRKSRDGAAAETRVRSHMKAPEDEFVFNWLAEVATEQPAKTHYPAGDSYDSPTALLSQTRGFTHASLGRYNETVAAERNSREKRRDSSDSSLIQPAYEKEGLSLRRKTTDSEDSGEDQNRHISKEKAKKRRQLASSTDDSQSEPDQSQRKETFEKRSRHKTKADRYESKKTRQQIVEDDKPAKKKAIKVKRGDAAKASRKASEDLINGFKPKNVAQDRLTMRPGTGIFKNGRASSPSRNRGLPDLAFSEMQFLKQSSKQPVDTEKEVIVSKSGQKTKRERERVRNEISNYFIPARQPLKETVINRGREVSTLPSDAGKSEATSVIRGYHCHPPVSPEKYQSMEKVLYEGFSTRGPSPQKFRLPMPNLGQIFIPRRVTESSNASNKPISYCTWSESVKSPIMMGKTVMAEASRDKSALSPSSRQRVPIRPHIYKEVGMQAVLDIGVDSPYDPAVRRCDNDTQVAMDKQQQQPANASSVRDIAAQNCTESQDDDRIDQLRADMAVLHDCEPHRCFEQRGTAHSEHLLEPLHKNSHVDPKHYTGRAKQMPEQCTQTGVDADKAQNSSVLPDQINSDSEVQYIMSRAVLAQRAYINRRSTPKVAVDDAVGAPDVRDVAKGEPDARDSGAPMENNEPLEIDQQRENEASYLLSELVDDRRNEDAGQPGQDQSLGHVSNLPVYEQAQNEDVYGAGYQPNEPDDTGPITSNLDMSHHAENIALPGHTEPPQLMIPTRGFSTGRAYIPPLQSRNMTSLETMDPINARQLQNQVFDAQEEQYEFHNPEDQGQGAIYLYEGGQWEREPHNAGAHQYNPTETEDAQVNYGDMYEYDGLDLIDESMYYEEELPFDAQAQMHGAAATDEMLFITQASGPSAGYQWMPRQQREGEDKREGNDEEDREAMEAPNNQPGQLSWRLSAHPITLLWFLGFRISSLLVYLFGLLFTSNFVLIFIITILLLAADFYYLKNIAGRRLVGLRWWNEVDVSTGDSQWVFESADPATKVVNATDSRFFWLAMYAQPLLWVALAILAVVRFEFIWLTLVVIALVLTITNTLAFSRCDKFSHASNLAGSALYSGGLARNLAGGVMSRFLGGRS
ncbi:hypothetical protein V495_05453 [Pseudogymnoascus sp. VKM F-4514 (FW-929)]|nr:hypothetical protein V495_05453 [Pseudogymnoascus sp. VKM F-4514 (FW-929)]KFY57043.1 hypothetical protein V497_05777 [Pseudogymnoascus sp. VKM F-4516 (FW-969)]